MACRAWLLAELEATQPKSVLVLGTTPVEKTERFNNRLRHDVTKGRLRNRPRLACRIMDRFRASALTHLLVVSDARASLDWYTRVFDASIYGEYGGTSVVLEFFGNWILLVTGGDPTADKPTVSFAPPADPDRVSAEIIFRVDDCRGTYELLRSRGAAFLAEPVDWGGEIRAFFRDPDGHLFEISQLTA